ncbi:DUF4177 domain-containing protein [Fibrella sp. WM1]|uniref:DUF4177 domain-containing protein n=1 Tax=Fibrella musci TaxID=3242485 RepID=UPI0035205693
MWEYLSFRFQMDELGDFQDKLNGFGEQGWELISLVPIETKSVGVFDSGSATSHILATFKRPKA